ncbi:DNA repair protein rad10 [Wallemia mellicola CBS 633.66]|uniref:DNA repair protein rad10 n=1 Tax=Wallemia mellicola (strain ATCC MYA-4683 / CBS 633.66) TaxID=671144 RepID=I4Y567_WALMC|nr:DNA repair protein rad10 [Wallemia mellicola CBS 633.66]EIM19109.1 DNA repair protein rad10 [Wallemia mellicola CBS 633.66]|eukprot:XP_006960836.1 DNA repair protein rad10 [Wallemia mellicola CBS 633.66]
MNGGNNTRDIQQKQPQNQQNKTQSPRRALPNSKNAVLVNSCQRGNPILKEVRNVSWEYTDIVPDYVAGSSTGILFLSLRYHRLHPEYIHTRVERLGAMYQLRILLLMCDVTDSEASIKEITKTCLINNITVVIAWSPQQAGHYLSLYLQLDNKPPDSLREKSSTDYHSMVANALTTVKGINKTDVYQLLTRFGSIKNIVKASPDEISKCPGFGDIKVRRMQEAFISLFKIGFKNSNDSSTASNDQSQRDKKTGLLGTESNDLLLRENSPSHQVNVQPPEEEIDLLDSDEDALNEVVANFDSLREQNDNSQKGKEQQN